MVLSEDQAINLSNRMYSSGVFESGVNPAGNPARWLTVQHYVFFLAWQPASRCWIFQSVETAVLLLLAAACAVDVTRLIYKKRARQSRGGGRLDEECSNSHARRTSVKHRAGTHLPDTSYLAAIPYRTRCLEFEVGDGCDLNARPDRDTEQSVQGQRTAGLPRAD
jgi:hypothetical protein